MSVPFGSKDVVQGAAGRQVGRRDPVVVVAADALALPADPSRVPGAVLCGIAAALVKTEAERGAVGSRSLDYRQNLVIRSYRDPVGIVDGVAIVQPKPAESPTGESGSAATAAER